MTTHCKENDMLTDEQKIHRAKWLHSSMLQRCGNYYQKINKAYEGVTVSTNFKSVRYFTEWCLSQTGFDTKDQSLWFFHLDKDLLSPPNTKIYSEDTCVFLPAEINCVLQTRPPSQRKLPRGVAYVKYQDKYSATVSSGLRTLNLGYFDTPQEASLVYNEAKLLVIQDLANKWESKISDKAYQALMSFDISRLIRQ